MATQTTNLKLIKPSYTDAADITIFSGNMDILDEEVNKRSKEGHKHKMSDIEGLSLKAKNVTIEDATGIFASDNVEGALSELFQNVSNGKSSIAKAITDKGVPASASDNFNTLANKISQIISELLDIPFPSFNVGIGSVSATFNTLDSTFKEFRIQGQSWQTSNIFSNLVGNTNYIFEAKYGGNRVSKLSLLTPKANQAKPKPPTANNIKADSITITAASGCKILFNGSEFDSPHTFTNLNNGTIYEFYSFVPSTNTLNKSPNSDALRVQTLDELTLFNNGSGPLSRNEMWKIKSSTAWRSWDITNTISLSAGYYADYRLPKARLGTSIGIDLSKYNTLVYKVSSLVAEEPGPNVAGYVEVWEDGTDNIIRSTRLDKAGIYKFDVSDLTYVTIVLGVHSQPMARATIEVSEIYLTN